MVRYAEPRDGSGEASVESVVDTPGGPDDNPRTSLVQAGSGGRPVLAERAQAGHARDDDTPAHAMPPLTEMACPGMYSAPSVNRNATVAAASSGRRRRATRLRSW